MVRVCGNNGTRSWSTKQIWSKPSWTHSLKKASMMIALNCHMSSLVHGDELTFYGATLMPSCAAPRWQILRLGGPSLTWHLQEDLFDDRYTEIEDINIDPNPEDEIPINQDVLEPYPGSRLFIFVSLSIWPTPSTNETRHHMLLWWWLTELD